MLLGFIVEDCRLCWIGVLGSWISDCKGSGVSFVLLLLDEVFSFESANII